MRAELLARMPDARAVVFEALSRALMPPRRLRVSEWAEAERIVAAESGSRFPGAWRNDRAPHLVDVMDAMGPDDTAEDVVFCASAQVGKSEAALNSFGWMVTQDPGPTIIVLPSYEEATKYVRTKLQTAIDATPTLRARVLEEGRRDERSSTTAFKRFRGGFAQITFAGSSKGLQMLSARYTIADEVSEWPAEAGDRGDPVEQLKVRTLTFERDRKRLWVSTPGVVGACRITAMYGASDQRRRYVPCPHCGAYQVLAFDRLKWSSETAPHHAWFECAAHGCVIEHVDKGEMMAGGVWIATAGDEGPGPWFAPEELARWREREVPTRIRGFHVWQAYSLFASWDSIVATFLGSKDAPQKLRAFTQQVLGEAWEERGEAPDAERLHAARVNGFAKGAPPVGPVAFTGAIDVQGKRLEWAVWGWSEGMTRWLVDWGIVQGDPADPATWAEMDAVMQSRRYRPGGMGAGIEVEAWAVDSGYETQAVYAFCRGRPRVFAIDGRKGRMHPFVGTPVRVNVNWRGKKIARGAMLWPVGGFALKSDLYGALRKTLQGPASDGAWRPGAAILPGDMDLGYAEQLSAETLVAIERRSGMVDHEWKKMAGRPNEALDIACYARAMAWHLGLDRLAPEDWARIRAERCGAPAEPEDADARQPDLFEVRVAPVPGAETAAPPPRRPAPSTDAGAAWIRKREGWL
jgi:phage terminase large subunit GpA-like protein